MGRFIEQQSQGALFYRSGSGKGLTDKSWLHFNIADIYSDRPLKDHPVYCAAKAGNVMLTKSLARELAPEVRVNGIAPGAILWPEQNDEQQQNKQQNILDRIPLARQGDPEDIAKAVEFLLAQAPYITGQIITVDGGRSLTG